MDRYIVMGTYFDQMASLHCTAESEADALEKWQKVFTRHAHFRTDVTNVDKDRPDMQCYFREDGYQFEC